MIQTFLVPATDGSNFYSMDFGPAASFFDVSAEQIVELEDGLERALRAAGYPAAEAVANELDNYRAQYVGLVVEGKRAIWGNYFCKSHDTAVSDPVSVDDGGHCYFQVLFDLLACSITNIYVNGVV